MIGNFLASKHTLNQLQQRAVSPVIYFSASQSMATIRGVGWASAPSATVSA